MNTELFSNLPEPQQARLEGYKLHGVQFNLRIHCSQLTPKQRKQQLDQQVKNLAQLAGIFFIMGYNFPLIMMDISLHQY
jgi:hypothetical protein